MTRQSNAFKYLIVIAVVFGASSCGGTAKNKWENSNGVFRVRVTEYEIPNFPLNSYRHVLESSPVASDEWSRVISYDSDDGFGLKPEQLHFVSDKVGYVYMANWFAVTTDGGATWAKKPFTQGWVREVSMLANGEGRLRIEVYSIEKEKPVLSFSTQTFGRQWNLTPD